MELGEPPETARNGHVGVCFLVELARHFSGTAEGVAFAMVVSQKWKEEPRSLSSSLPFAFSHQPPVAGLSSPTPLFRLANFGMTHEFFFSNIGASRRYLKRRI